jgi:hypothetical protein
MARRKRRPSLLAWLAAGALLAVAGVIGWRAFGVRGVGRFPILSDVPTRATAVPAPPNKVRPQLRAKAEAARRTGGRLTFLVDLATQVDIDRFGELLDRRGLRNAKAERKQPFLDAFRLVADHAEAPLLAHLETLRAAGRVERVDAFHIASRVAVVARDPGVVDELAARPDVAALIEDAAPGAGAINGQVDGGVAPGAADGGAGGTGEALGKKVDPVSWAIDAIGAPAAWARGLDGRGVVVGLLDTGADARHVQLRDN